MFFVEVLGNAVYRTLMAVFLNGHQQAGLAQSVERQALNLMVEGSSPSFGEFCPLGGARLSVAGAAAGLQNRG